VVQTELDDLRLGAISALALDLSAGSGLQTLLLLLLGLRAVVGQELEQSGG
jgi:hypothetical protein